MQIVKNNPSIQNPIDFHDWARGNYAIAMSILVRKQVEGGSIGIRKLVNEIKSTPQDLNLSWYESLYSKGIRPFAESTFITLAGGIPHISEGVLMADIKCLENIYSRVGQYASKKIAHNTGFKFTQLPTYNDLDEAILELERIGLRYIQLLSGNGINTLEPVWQYDWTNIFKEKWIKQMVT